MIKVTVVEETHEVSLEIDGKEIIVHGEMQSRKWQDKDGNNRISWEIQNAHAEFCGGKSDNSAPSEPVSDFAVIDDMDSSLPL